VISRSKTVLVAAAVHLRKEPHLPFCDQLHIMVTPLLPLDGGGCAHQVTAKLQVTYLARQEFVGRMFRLREPVSGGVRADKGMAPPSCVRTATHATVFSWVESL